MREGRPVARSRRAAAPARRLRLPDGRRGGVHLTHGGGLLRAAERAAHIGASAFQIFSDNPTSWRRRPELPPALPEFRARLAEFDLRLAIHAAYLVNLAGPDEELFARSVDVLAREMTIAPAFGASFVNVHVGSHRGAGREAGIVRVVEGVERVLTAAADAAAYAEEPKASQAVLVLENGSGGGDGIGVTVGELEALLEEAARRHLENEVRFCLDTAHLWGAGYDISTAAGMDEVIDEFGRRIGLERLALVHFNDSLSPLGSRHDRHTHIGAGQIGTEGMARLISHPALGHVTFLLETPGSEEGYDAVNLRRMGLLAAGRALPRLPLAATREPAARARRESAA